MFVVALAAATLAMQVGQTLLGRVARIQPYGAFITLDGTNRDGLLHISQLDPSGSRVSSVDALVSVGDRVRVRVLSDESGKVALTAQGVSQPSDAPAALRWTPPAKLGSPPTAAELERLDCVRLSFARSGGAGGQNVNKVNTKCTARLSINESPWPEAVRSRLRASTDVTSGGELLVQAETYRTQSANRKEAVEKLAKRVAEAWRPPKQRRMYEGLSYKGKRQRRDDKRKQSQKKAARRRPGMNEWREERRGVLTRLVGAGSMLPLLAAAQPAHALGGFTALGLAAKERRRKQQECFDRLECAEAVPAYDISCARGDEACLERRQRLARQEVKAAIAEPGGAIGVLAILVLGSVGRLFRGRE